MVYQYGSILYINLYNALTQKAKHSPGAGLFELIAKKTILGIQMPSMVWLEKIHLVEAIPKL